MQCCIPYGRWGGPVLFRFCSRVNPKYHPIPLLAVEVHLKTWISCKYTASLMRGGWSGYTLSRGKFSYNIENLTKNLYLRCLVQCDSCFLSGFLTLLVRDVFILEPLTYAWKCDSCMHLMTGGLPFAEDINIHENMGVRILKYIVQKCGGTGMTPIRLNCVFIYPKRACIAQQKHTSLLPPPFFC